jgi:hypothetical protein
LKPPDILNSKIKKIRIELPHYSFSHSSSGDSSHAFIGRIRSREKLKQIIEDSPDEPGVYLIAGNRGAGKTSLVSEVIKETSLRPKTKFTENLRYAILLFLLVAGIQFFLNEFTEIIDIDCTKYFSVVWPILFILTFITIGRLNVFRRKKNGIFKNICYGFTSAFIEMSYLINPYAQYGKLHYVLKMILVVSFMQIIKNGFYIASIKVFLIYLSFVLLCMYIRFVKDKWRKNKKSGIVKSLGIIFRDSFFASIKNYIKNYNRLYLRINFGHKVNDEKDILRLIARTLKTEYNKFHRSFLRKLPWRVIALGFLLLFALLFTYIKRQDSNDSKNDGNSLEFVITNLETKVETKANTEIEVKVKTNVGNRVAKIINMLKCDFSETSQRTMAVLEHLFGNNGDIDKSKIREFNFFFDYHFLLSFLLLYLFCLLLFRLAWVLHLFVTHGRIMRRLKKLNSDITYSTERENSIGINSEKSGPIIVGKAKKSRSVADAREIEKELQDILDDMQRIPVIMCRPKVVIVFDELDKVEPGDTGMEKEILQTKASLFSINATRERQTEILRILSNMKYFLSTAKAKFIFIAGREMYDIYLADVAERNNYIGSIFNAVILVPSFLTDHHTGKKIIPQESSIASLPEEFVCRRLIPHDYPVDSYNLKNYRKYLEKEIFRKDNQNSKQKEESRQDKIQKIIAVLQQFIIYLAHVSKGAPKKMIQLFESFVEINIENGENKKNTLFVQRYHNSQHFLSFNYYKQYTLGIVAYLITPVFYRLAESNIKELSDRLLVSSLRFVDFLFKFHKNHFSWKHLDMSPEMLEVNRAPELKSVVVDLLNYFAQVHINKSNFSLSEYKFDSLIANEIFAMAKTDEVFSALFSFSLDEMLPIKNRYQELLKETQEQYRKEDKNEQISFKYSDAISSLQGVLGDLHYYDDELEQAEMYYKRAVQEVPKNFEQLYAYVRNMLRLGIIYEKRKQYDFAYITYGEICKKIIKERNNPIAISTNCDKSIDEITFEGLKMLYLPFIAKLQILELSHIGGIASNHLVELDDKFNLLTHKINQEGARFLKAEFYSRVADILYYKNSDLKCKECKNRIEDNDDREYCDNCNKEIPHKNCSCTACYYYHKALSILLNLDKVEKIDDNSVKKLLNKSIDKLKDNYNMKFCTILARILSDWGNVFFSCDISDNTEENKEYKESECYICDNEKLNTIKNDSSQNFLNYCEKYLELEEKKDDSPFLKEFQLETKRDIAFAMYSMSSVAYRRVHIYKRSSFQIYKMLCLFKDYNIYNSDYITRLSKIAIHYLWYANDDLNVLELNKRKKDFGKFDKDAKDEIIPLQYLLVDTEITRIRILVKELELRQDKNKAPKDLIKYYDLRITSPYKINYSIIGRIYRLRLKAELNYETYKKILNEESIINKKDPKKEKRKKEIKKILENNDCSMTAKKIFGEAFDIIQIFENLIAESIYCLTDAAQLLETMDETHLFPHSFIGSIYEHLSSWVRLYEAYEEYKKEDRQQIIKNSRIEKYLQQYLDEEWREQLSGYRENQRALSHYYKCLEMHNGGRAYHIMIDNMCYVMDSYNDRSDHFNIAEERHLILNGRIGIKINDLKDIYEDSELYKVDNYFNSNTGSDRYNSGIQV